MPKSKLKSTPNGTPESPRKTPKKEPTPKKRDSSESPVRIPKEITVHSLQLQINKNI